MKNLETYFSEFRKNIIGIDATFESPYGQQKLVYADWIASGRLYKPIEERICNIIAPLVGNTHSEASETGRTMTLAYHQAHKIIKAHVNANQDDVIITTDSGMTGVVNKFQRILGLKVPERTTEFCVSANECFKERPIVFVTHLEHHSNHTSWLETIAEVVVLEPDSEMNVSPDALRKIIGKYKDRKLLLGSFSACSNVTGVKPPYYELARIMHEHGGYCFVDFAASAPYLTIDMHPQDPLESLDAIFFSPHKFLGGPGSSGVVIFNKVLYRNRIPDHPGGGTVTWTNRWGEHRFHDDIEAREDGGTPGFLQAMRTAFAIRLKEKMGVENMEEREKELINIVFEEFEKIKEIYILAKNEKDRLGVFSFYVKNIHHNLMVRLLNDRFGIQVRGGCSCAGTYGHFILNVDIKKSKEITEMIDHGDFSLKPGWVRLSLHPTMTNEELYFIIDAIKQTVENSVEWSSDYIQDKTSGEFFHKLEKRKLPEEFDYFFDL